MKHDSFELPGSASMFQILVRYIRKEEQRGSNGLIKPQIPSSPYDPLNMRKAQTRVIFRRSRSALASGNHSLASNRDHDDSTTLGFEAHLNC